MSLTLSSMRATLSSMRRLLGRSWQYEVREGHSRQLERGHYMYNPVVSYRHNRLIIAPSMVITHRSIKSYSVDVEIGNDWGDIKIKFQDGVRVEMTDPEKAVEHIKQNFGEKTWIF